MCTFENIDRSFWVGSQPSMMDVASRMIGSLICGASKQFNLSEMSIGY